MDSAHSTPTLTPPPQEVANLPVSGIYKVNFSDLTFILDTNVNPGELFKYTSSRNDSRRSSGNEATVRQLLKRNTNP
jgi:hypothetical protein